MEKRTTEKRTRSIDELTGRQALQILRFLSQKNPDFAEAVNREADKLFKKVPVEEIADTVYRALNGIPVEDCWDTAGRQRGGGYLDVVDVADDMMRETVSRFSSEIDRYHRLGKCGLERSYIQAVVLGLYRFNTQSTTDFSEYVQDMSETFACDFIEAWMKLHSDDKKGIKELYAFVSEQCPEWTYIQRSFLAKTGNAREY